MASRELPACDWEPGSFEQLKQIIADLVVDSKRRSEVLSQIASLDPAKPLDGEEALARVWRELAQASPPAKEYEIPLADMLRKIGCDDAFALRGLAANLRDRFSAGSPHPAKLAAAFLDIDHCAAARDLSEQDKKALLALRDIPGAPNLLTPAAAKE